jgi:hypothetical protein
MTEMRLDAHLSSPIDIDICSSCQAFWFDKYESLKLSPASVLQLMKLIAEHPATGATAVSGTLACPRCAAHLLLTNDMQRATRFSYWRCGNEHGKFMRFFDFLKEKNFVRPMPAQQLDELRQNMQTVHCANCGAPIDLAASSSCAHCGSAISILDRSQAQKTLAQLQQAAAPRPVDPALPFELERAKRELDRSLGPAGGTGLWESGTSSDLVQDVLNSVAKWIFKGAL